MSSLRDAALLLCEALDSIGIAYAIGGSFASSIHGISRATQDLDFIAAINLSHVDALANALSAAFYADSGMMRDGIRLKRPFNVIHTATAFKMDIFPVQANPLGAQQIARRQYPASLQLGGAPVALPVISAEDTILVKLRWYKDGGETSERQWNDLRNIVHVQRNRMDEAYLDQWANKLGVSKLLLQLLSEAPKLPG